MNSDSLVENDSYMLPGTKFKSLFITIILFIVVFQSFGQRKLAQNLRYYDHKRLHFGFTVGFNYMDFLIRQDSTFLNTGPDTIYSIENKIAPGFQLGPIVDFRLNNHFNVRSLIILTFGERDMIYEEYDSNLGRMKTTDMKIESVFLQFPFLIKYRAKRLNNFRPFVIAGATPMYDLAAQKKQKDDNYRIRLNKIDYAYELGAGVDFYLPYFMFSTEISYVGGVTNVINYDDKLHTTILDKLNSRIIMLSFHFQ